MISKPDKNKLRQKRHTRVRGKISGTTETPRLNVFRSNTNIYAQVIDDATGTTLASASSLKLTGTKTEQAAEVGKLVAEAAKAKGVEEVVFDRGGYLYVRDVTQFSRYLSEEEGTDLAHVEQEQVENYLDRKSVV